MRTPRRKVKLTCGVTLLKESVVAFQWTVRTNRIVQTPNRQMNCDYYWQK